MINRVIGDGRNFLDQDQLRLASITADHQGLNTSDKYSFFSTLNILGTLKNAGWLPVKVQEQAVKMTNRDGFQKHLVRLRQEGQKLQDKGDILLYPGRDVFEVLLVPLGKDNRPDAGAVGGKHLLLDAADRQHLAPQRQFAGQRHFVSHRGFRGCAEQRDAHRHASRRAVLART